MSQTIASAEAAAKKDEGKFLKFLKAVKKFISKEFLWVLFVLLLAMPVTAIAYYLIHKILSPAEIQELENALKNRPLYQVLYLLSIAGIYFSRAVIGALKGLTAKKKPQ